MLFTASLFGAHFKTYSEEIKPASLPVVSLSKTVYKLSISLDQADDGAKLYVVVA